MREVWKTPWRYFLRSLQLPPITYFIVVYFRQGLPRHFKGSFTSDRPE